MTISINSQNSSQLLANICLKMSVLNIRVYLAFTIQNMTKINVTMANKQKLIQLIALARPQ